MSSDKELYNIIADEMSTKTMDPALWTQALAIAEGNPNKAQAAYIKLRFVELKRAAAPTQQVASSQAPSAALPDGELARMRADLARRLRAEGKSSFYATIGVDPGVSDADVASAIQAAEERMQGSVPPEFRYAKEALGNPQSRASYDRMMLDTLRQRQTVSHSSSGNDDADSEGSWWHTTKTSVIIGVLSITLLGYLGLGFFKEKGGQKIQEETLKASTDIVKSTTDVEQTNATRMMDAAQEARDRDAMMRDRQMEYQREEQERRYELQREQIDLQKQQMANQQQQRQEQQDSMRQQRERQYWACVNQQVNVYQPSGTSAMARCAYLRP